MSGRTGGGAIPGEEPLASHAYKLLAWERTQTAEDCFEGIAEIRMPNARVVRFKLEWMEGPDCSTWMMPRRTGGFYEDYAANIVVSLVQDAFGQPDDYSSGTVYRLAPVNKENPPSYPPGETAQQAPPEA